MHVSRPDVAHSVTRGAFYLAIEKVAALISGTLFFVVMLRLLGPTKYGIMTLALSIVALATMATGNFEMFLERYAAEYHAQGRLLTLRRAQRLSLMLKLGMGLVAGLGLIALSPLLARQFGAPDLARLLPLLAVTVAGDGFATTGRAVLYGLQRFRELTLLSVLFHVAKIALVCSLWFMRQGLVALAVGLAAITVALGIAQTVVPMWMLRRVRDEGDPPADREQGTVTMRSILSYSTPLMGARITFLTGQNLGKVVLGKLFEPAQLGYFSFAFQTIERFVELIYILPASLLPSFTQLVARANARGSGWCSTARTV
jgi:O-antigen/teichoic acid export membrane protein